MQMRVTAGSKARKTEQVCLALPGGASAPHLSSATPRVRTPPHTSEVMWDLHKTNEKMQWSPSANHIYADVAYCTTNTYHFVKLQFLPGVPICYESGGGKTLTQLGQRSEVVFINCVLSVEPPNQMKVKESAKGNNDVTAR